MKNLSRPDYELEETMKADGFDFWTNADKDSYEIVDNNDGTKNLSLYLKGCRKTINKAFADIRISELAYTAYGTRDLTLVGIYVKPLATSI